MTDLFDNLNEKQKEAVLETEGYVRVIAGAGSGKTKLLVSRYVYLVQDYGIDSSNILCVTFTNKAAGEMKKRIRALIGENDEVSLIYTYHGFCNRLLRENPEKLFLNKQFQIIDSRQQKAMLSEIYQKYELKLDYASFESILKKIGYIKKDTEYVTRLCNPGSGQILNEIRNQDDRIIEDFLQKQKATYSLDFHDLISFAIYLLETDSEIRKKWQKRLNYIMVDEFQDSSFVEMRLVEILSGQYHNLMIVGDPDQNIYEWRGSDVKLLVDFDKKYMDTKTIILNQNYRSTPQILRCANTLIEKNKMRLKKDLFTKNVEGAPVIHYHSRNDFEEMDQVIANIKRLTAEEGLKYSDFAIIYRSGFLSRVAEKKLVEKNIPYEIFGGVRFYQRMEIQDILAYLKLIAFDDDVSFRRIVNTPRRRFGRMKMNLLEELKGKEPDQTFFALLSGHQKENEFSKSDVGSFIRMVESMRTSYRTKRISDIVNEVTKESGYERYIRELGDEERLDNLAEFKRIANEFEREFGENITLEEFLQQISLRSGEDESDSKEVVKLMTIHSSKGLEFPVVFILGLTEGVFPSAKTLGDQKLLGLEEERRLCYVAITRAEKYLFLMESEGTTQNGNKKLISRFLKEIGDNNYVRIGRISEELEEESREYAARLNQGIQTQGLQDDGRKIGDVVEHHIFGEGKIEEVDIKRGSYTIWFEKLNQSRSISKNYFMKVRKDIWTGAPEQKEKERTQTKGADAEELGTKQRGTALSGKGSVEITLPKAESGKTEGIVSEIELNKTEEVVPETDVTRSEDIERTKEFRKNSVNLWKCEDVPHSGWSCTGVEDLGAPVGICEMCGYQIIRYVHHMEHPEYRNLAVGCVCAGRMEGDVEGAKRREAEFKNRQSRRTNFLKRKWKRSKKGNEYLKIDSHIVVLYQDMKGKGVWKYSVDNEFFKDTFATREEAVEKVFYVLEKMKN
ncbi:MAG: UvrD-helicase domain-containing protein [Dorea sp.]|jgi:DNA helicase-2/ATP-dependent DNA helicase PcrA|nr:UvrD-helicase domain-containing protein [Dorea sp.]